MTTDLQNMPSPSLLRQWENNPENDQCWGLSAVADYMESKVKETFEPILNPADLASALAHRACCGTEHDPPNGKLHGFCVVCGVPWPCETAQYFLRNLP